MARYSVKPFSGKNFSKNENKCPDGTMPCAICGKPVQADTNGNFAHSAAVISGGADWGDENSDEDSAGHMGWFPVGNDCHKRYAVK